MVSLRRSKLYRLLAGTNILLPKSAFADDGTLLLNYSHYSKSTSVHPVDLDETKQEDEENSDPKEKQDNQKVDDSSLVQESPLKRRKRHKRKNVENQETGFMRGVYFKNMKWQAAIKIDKKQIHLGTVGSQEEAARLYDRAAFMCGREPNFKLSEEEKNELRKYSWDEFLAMTRHAITHKKGRRRVGAGFSKSRRRVGVEFSKKSEPSSLDNEDSEEDDDLSGSEDAEPEISDS